MLFLNEDGTVESSSKIADGDGVPPLADGDRFGTSVAAIGDLNGDGISDLLVGSCSTLAGRGAAHLVSLDAGGSAKGRTLEFTVTRARRFR